LIELLVVIAIIAILAAILFPVFAQAREKARQAACLSNVRQMATAVAMYLQDFEAFPMYAVSGQETRWWNGIEPYLKSREVYICPTVPQLRYGRNMAYGTTISTWAIPEVIVGTYRLARQASTRQQTRLPSRIAKGRERFPATMMSRQTPTTST
ncbi:MAG: DUF1559 family PulG-like putative transporter, partial [Armatimonadota bacterium]